MGIIGARAYYVLFNWDWYAGDIMAIINIRQGGLAIHGGLILGLGTAAVLCKVFKVNPVEVLDLCAPSIAIGQAIGRWGNYFNSEAHGGPTNLPWGVLIDGRTYHPTFLYESIWCLLLFFLLLLVEAHGQICHTSYQQCKDKKQWNQHFFVHTYTYLLSVFYLQKYSIYRKLQSKNPSQSPSYTKN